MTDKRPADDEPDDGVLDVRETHAEAERAWDGFVARLESRDQLRLEASGPMPPATQSVTSA